LCLHNFATATRIPAVASPTEMVFLNYNVESINGWFCFVKDFFIKANPSIDFNNIKCYA